MIPTSTPETRALILAACESRQGDVRDTDHDKRAEQEKARRLAGLKVKRDLHKHDGNVDIMRAEQGRRRFNAY